MKSLQDFIIESNEINEGQDTASITFDFTDLENAEETIESLKDKEGVEVDDKKVTVNINKDNASKLDSVQDILQQYSETIRNSQKRTNDEQYAQKTKTFAEKVGEFNDALDAIDNPDEDDDNKEDE